ncbi:unnamed protein product [Adineta steineri]|uniref:Uncharacterized protein n=1 Tax=Adineta steineri TaxID=433720 RepID=A0A815S907_9BILA|nr:unnamed protein product [Adineta steineri]CAF3904132.1 unnamed protein product [Adineta steineri]
MESSTDNLVNFYFIQIQLDKLRRPLLLIIVMAVTIYIAYITTITVRYSYKPQQKHNGPRGVIVTLIRSTNRSILLTINMIHSVMKFHSINSNSSYPFLIFHDQNLTSHMRQHLLSCVLKHSKTVTILFALIHFSTSILPYNMSNAKQGLGYRFMCRFWTYDVFYHPAVKDGQYDYLMRMDADSYFSDDVKHDLFLYMTIRNLDYMYRSYYTEPSVSMKPLLQHFFENKPFITNCIYNNFFIMHLKWYYESEPVQTFVNELIRDQLILREYIGDGCTHAVMLKIDKQVKVELFNDIPYGHNYHVMPPRKRMIFSISMVEKFKAELEKSCHQLTVLRGPKGELTQMDMS